MSTTYTYEVENKLHEVKLSRRLTVVTTWQIQGKEITAKNEVSRFTETIRVAGRQYKLDSKRSLLDFSNVTLHEPAVSYFAGNLEGRKVYTIGRNEGEVVVEITSSSTGYRQPWGRVEIQDGYGTIRCELINTETGTIKWNGTFNSQVSHSTKTDLQYVPNEPVQISFPGGFLKTETSEGILRISYDLPRLDEEGVPSGSRRQRGEQTINLTGTPKTERLPVPQYSDVRGRWSEKISAAGQLRGREPKVGTFTPQLQSTAANSPWLWHGPYSWSQRNRRLPEAVALTDETRRRRRAPIATSPPKMLTGLILTSSPRGVLWRA